MFKSKKFVVKQLNLKNENHARVYNGFQDVQPEVHVGQPAGAAEPLAGVPDGLEGGDADIAQQSGDLPHQQDRGGEDRVGEIGVPYTLCSISLSRLHPGIKLRTV